MISMFRAKQTMHVNGRGALEPGLWRRWSFGGRGSGGGGKVVFGVNRVVLRII